MKISLFAVLALLSPLTSFADPVIFTATVYELGSNRQKPLFKQVDTERDDGAVKIRHATFTDMSGKEAVNEDLRTRDGKFERYEVHSLQTGDSGFVDARSGKLFFSYTRDGETQTDQEDLAGNFIVAPMTPDFLKANWQKIQAGDTVDARFGVLDRKETVGFKFFKSGDKSAFGAQATVVTMKPSSFVIAAIVNPLTFTLDGKSARLLELVGRTLPKLKVDGKWKDLDADIVYSYPDSKGR